MATTMSSRLGALSKRLLTTSPRHRLLPQHSYTSSPAIQLLSTRHSSHSPLGHPAATTRTKVTLNTLASMYKRAEPITMLTASDFPSAHVADHAGIDMVLVGDSLAMVALGLEDTSEVTLDEMIMCCRAVSRAVKGAFTVCVCSHTSVFIVCVTKETVY